MYFKIYQSFQAYSITEVVPLKYWVRQHEVFNQKARNYVLFLGSLMVRYACKYATYAKESKLKLCVHNCKSCISYLKIQFMVKYSEIIEHKRPRRASLLLNYLSYGKSHIVKQCNLRWIQIAQILKKKPKKHFLHFQHFP